MCTPLSNNYFTFDRFLFLVCECDSAGSESNACDISSGVCRCKLHTEGERCDRCKIGTFNLDARNEDGCQSCFGYRHGTECISAQGFIAANITTDFTGMNSACRGVNSLHVNINIFVFYFFDFYFFFDIPVTRQYSPTPVIRALVTQYAFLYILI